MLMSHTIVFALLFFSTSLYALWRGGTAERLAVATVVAGSILTVLLYSPHGARFAQVEAGVMIADIVVLAGFMGLACFSTRFWPIWVSGLQLVAVIVHILRLISPTILPVPYMMVLAFWSYPIQFLLAVAAHRHWVRLRTRGWDGSWRGPVAQ
jgi:hypothetical protein